MSIALGELREWTSSLPYPQWGREDFHGITYRKLGLAGAGAHWADTWASLRRDWGPGPAWVAVIYADWVQARSPHPDEVLDVALSLEDCAGVLLDTYDKGRPSPVDRSWSPVFERVRESGRFVALAGGLDARAIAHLSPLGPDLFAVRGAACAEGDRRGTIDAARVAVLARAAGGSCPSVM